MIKWSTHLERYIHSWIVASWEDKADPKWYPSHTSSEGMENYFGLSIFLVEGHKCPAQDKNKWYFTVGCTSKYYIVILYIYIISQIAFLVIIDRFFWLRRTILIAGYINMWLAAICQSSWLLIKFPAAMLNDCKTNNLPETTAFLENWSNPACITPLFMAKSTVVYHMLGHIPHQISPIFTYQISTKMFGHANQIYTLNYYCLASTMVALNSFSQNANHNYSPSGPII